MLYSTSFWKILEVCLPSMTHIGSPSCGYSFPPLTKDTTRLYVDSWSPIYNRFLHHKSRRGVKKDMDVEAMCKPYKKPSKTWVEILVFVFISMLVNTITNIWEFWSHSLWAYNYACLHILKLLYLPTKYGFWFLLENFLKLLKKAIKNVCDFLCIQVVMGVEAGKQLIHFFRVSLTLQTLLLQWWGLCNALTS